MVIKFETFLVTGGAGFIGSHLVDALLKLNKKVICIDNFNDYYDPKIKEKNLEDAKKHPDFVLYREDIRNYEGLKTIFEKYNIECVVNLAARAGVRPSIKQPLLYEKVNCIGTLNLLELARKFKVKSFIQASSSSVYGNNKKVPFSEDDNVDFPISPYAATKKANELMCYTYHHLYGLHITCLRFFTVYGPRQRPEMAIHKFTHLIDKGEEIPMYGDGNTKRDYTYISDIIQGILKAIEYNYPYEIINLGESQTTKLIDLIYMIAKELGKTPKIKKLPMQPGDVICTYADISKAKKLLGYNPTTPIENGIKKFVKWYKSIYG